MGTVFILWHVNCTDWTRRDTFQAVCSTRQKAEDCYREKELGKHAPLYQTEDEIVKVDGPQYGYWIEEVPVQ